MHLPAPLDGYFAAANTRDIDRIVSHDATDATVDDERHTYRGHAAIHGWAVEARAKYDFQSEPFRVEQDVRGTIVHAHVSGDFPGSPVDLAYRFVVADGAIQSLSIG